MTETEYKCSDCGKVCKTKGALKIHMKTHDDLHSFKEKVEAENKIKTEEIKKSEEKNKENIDKILKEKDEYIKKLEKEVEYLKEQIKVGFGRVDNIIHDMKQLSNFLNKIEYDPTVDF